MSHYVEGGVRVMAEEQRRHPRSEVYNTTIERDILTLTLPIPEESSSRVQDKKQSGRHDGTPSLVRANNKGTLNGCVARRFGTSRHRMGV